MEADGHNYHIAATKGIIWQPRSIRENQFAYYLPIEVSKSVGYV